MKRTLLIAMLSLSVIVGCQKNDAADLENQKDGMAMDKVGTQVVRAANGTLYIVECLRKFAPQIESKNEIPKECKFDPKTGEGRSFWNPTSSNYYVYYPPTYYSPSAAYYYTYPLYGSGTSYGNGSTCTSCSTSGSVTYPLYGGGSGYSGGYDTSKSFCGFVFGSSTSFNCYLLFGYGGSSWTKSYDDRCDHCLYAYNPSRCRNRCWNSYSYHW